MGAAARVMALLRQPIAEEKRALLDRRWADLPEELRTDWQALGRQIVHCGYTMGAPYCSFGCTHCYLPKNANRAPLPSLAEMKAQIDANARLIGPNGGLQITGGDVVDAYFRAGRQDELVDVVRYATGAGVVPMLMTHGQLLLENPGYLDRLVLEGGLRKLAVHIDMTQAGRPGFPVRQLRSEVDLHPLRAAFVDLILGSRRRTAKPLQAAHTVTVTERNLNSVGEIVRWLCAERRRLRAFSMISLQTEADVGRTRFSGHPVTPEATWDEVVKGVGMPLTRGALWVGHPDCSSITTVLVDGERGPRVELFGADAASRRFLAALLRVFGGVGSRGASNLEANVQRLALLLRHPSMLLEAVRFARSLARRAEFGADFVWRLLSGRVGTLNVVLHNFMSEDQVQSNDPIVAKRLAACSFQGAVLRDGLWRAVPMCGMNARERETIYEEQIAAADGIVAVDGIVALGGSVSVPTPEQVPTTAEWVAAASRA
jgi:hypothetical protein